MLKPKKTFVRNVSPNRRSQINSIKSLNNLNNRRHDALNPDKV